MPHLDRALKVFLRGKDDLVSQAGQYAAVAIHMEDLGQTSHNVDIAGRGKKVFNTLKYLQFVAFCHFLAHVLQVIATLSQTLQKADLILPSAVAAVESCLTSLDYMKTNPLPDGMLKTFITQCLEKQTPGAHITTFQCIDLRGERESLMDNLRQQMKHACSACEKHLHAKLDNLLGVNKDQNAHAVMSAFAIFNHDK